jgi:hypothetical protein
MGSNERHVVPNPFGGWDIRVPGAPRASDHAGTQEEAIDRARTLVRQSGGGEVVIHGSDGRVRESDTVPPGNGPDAAS